jgi:GTP-binding protein
MEAYFESRADGAWLIQLVDAKVGATPLDVETRRYFNDLGVPQDVVATKIDRVRRGARRAALESIRRELALGEAEIIPFSARTGEGTKQLWRAIDARLTGLSGGSVEKPGARAVG